MTEPNVSQWFVEFEPTPKQLRKLATLLKGIHTRWGIDYGDSFIEATLVVAPGELSQLTPAAYDLLKRCQNRIWEFKVGLDEEYGVFHKQTYGELFDLLLSLGLIVKATLRQRLKGSKNAEELRVLLKSKGLSNKGKKDELVDRVLQSLSQEEQQSLLTDVILFRTTEAGDRAVQTIQELFPKMLRAFCDAVGGTMQYFEAEKETPPDLPPGVFYDDGKVRTTEAAIMAAGNVPPGKPMDVKELMAMAEITPAGNVPLGEPLDEEELLAMAEITPEVIDAAMADWRATAPAWAKDILDAEKWHAMVERHLCERCGVEQREAGRWPGRPACTTLGRWT